MRKSILITAALFLTNSFGLPYVNTTLDKVRTTKSGNGYIYLTDALQLSNCQTPKILHFDLNTDAGKSMLSVALIAISTDKPVYIEAYDTCEVSLIEISKT